MSTIDLIGATVTGIARIFYEYRGTTERADGPLELTLGERTVLLDGQSDGQRLRVRQEAWNDPFAEPLSAENHAWLAEHGKWVRVDCADQPEYADFIGRQIVACVLLREDAFGSIAGLKISVAPRSLWFIVQGDESHVAWSLPAGFSETRQDFGRRA